MRPISKEKKDDIETLLRQNLFHRAIAERVGGSVATVNRTSQEEDVVTTNVAGRPRKISTHLGRAILRAFNTGEYENALDAAKKLKATGVELHPDTIRNLLHRAPFHASLKKPALSLTSARKQARLGFAKRHRHWTVDDWKTVVFSDETKINRIGSDGAQWTWRQEGRPIQDHNVDQVYKHGGGSLFIWGCMTYHGIGFMTKIEGGLNAALYSEILSDEFLKTLEYYG